MPRLTDVAIRNLPLPPAGQKLYYDDTLPSFGCRVSQGGTKSFFVQIGRDRQFITIGRYHPDILPLAKARGEAKRILAEQVLGRHRPESITCEAAVTLFLAAAEQKNKPRTVRDYKRLLNRHFQFGTKQLAEITPADINRRIDKLTQTPSEQNHALVCARIFMRWAQRRRYIEHSPTDGMQTTKRASRDRILSNDELRAIYKTAQRLDNPLSRIILLCIHIGLRRSEVAWLRRSYLNGDILTLPAPLMKNKRECVIPIGLIPQHLIETIASTDDRLFPADRGDKVFGGWSKQKAAFDDELQKAGYKVKPWVLHDLRRFFATTHAAIGTPIHLTERLLHHVSGATTGGLISIYQRYDFMAEMREAVDKYNKRLITLLEQS